MRQSRTLGLYSFCPEHLPERGGEDRIAIMNQEPQRAESATCSLRVPCSMNTSTWDTPHSQDDTLGSTHISSLSGQPATLCVPHNTGVDPPGTPITMLAEVINGQGPHNFNLCKSRLNPQLMTRS
jgi:hypothetical protein